MKKHLALEFFIWTFFTLFIRFLVKILMAFTESLKTFKKSCCLSKKSFFIARLLEVILMKHETLGTFSCFQAWPIYSGNHCVWWTLIQWFTFVQSASCVQYLNASLSAAKVKRCGEIFITAS